MQNCLLCHKAIDAGTGLPSYTDQPSVYHVKCVEREGIRADKNYYLQEIREAEQVLGKALGYPWYKDDQANFPGATEIDGVCTGEHTLVTLAIEIAGRL